MQVKTLEKPLFIGLFAKRRCIYLYKTDVRSTSRANAVWRRSRLRDSLAYFKFWPQKFWSQRVLTCSYSLYENQQVTKERRAVCFHSKSLLWLKIGNYLFIFSGFSDGF